MLTLNIPREWLLTANQRLHWRLKAEKTSCIRQMAAIETRRQRPGYRLLKQAACRVEIAWPNARRRDAHNLLPTLKAAIDGLVDARLLIDDSDRYLVGPDLRVTDDRCDPRYGCRLTFTFEETP